MSVKEGKKGNPAIVGKESYFLEILDKEAENIKESAAIMGKISDKHKIEFREIIEILGNREKYAAIPIGLFREELGPLEALVRYLHDALGYSFSKISKLISRDESTIWTTYRNSVKKSEKLIVDVEMRDVDFKLLKLKKDSLFVPLSVFSLRALSILESLSVYMRENFKLGYHDIGLILKRDERTIWTCVSRARKKLENA